MKLDELKDSKAKKEEISKSLDSKLKNMNEGNFDEQWGNTFDIRLVLGPETVEGIKANLKADMDNKLVRALNERLKFDKEIVFSNHEKLTVEIGQLCANYRDQISFITKNRESIANDLTGEIVKMEKQVAKFVNTDNKCERKWIEMSKDNELKLQFIRSLDFQIDRQNSLLRQYESDFEELKAKIDGYIAGINKITDNGPKTLIAYENLSCEAFNKKQEILKNASFALADAFKWFVDIQEQLEAGNKALEENSRKLQLEFKEIFEKKTEIEGNIESLRVEDIEFNDLINKYDEFRDLQFELSLNKLDHIESAQLLPAMGGVADKLINEAWAPLDKFIALFENVERSEKDVVVDNLDDLETKRQFFKLIKGFKTRESVNTLVQETIQMDISNTYSFDLYSNHEQYFQKGKENDENWNTKGSDNITKTNRGVIVAKQLCINN